MSRLDDLNGLLMTAEEEVLFRRAEVVRLQAAVTTWGGEVARLYNRWQGIADNIFNRNRRAEAEASYNAANATYQNYVNILNTERQILAAAEIRVEQILDDIDAYNAAVNTGIESGFGETGSQQIADAQLDLQAQQAKNLTAEEEGNKNKRTIILVILILVAIGIGAGIFFYVKKSRDKKK